MRTESRCPARRGTSSAKLRAASRSPRSRSRRRPARSPAPGPSARRSPAWGTGRGWWRWGRGQQQRVAVGLERTTVSVPMVVPAPGLFSITTGWPRPSDTVLAGDAGHDVGDAAGREWHHDAHRARRKRLSTGPGPAQASQSGGGQQQEAAAGGSGGGSWSHATRWPPCCQCDSPCAAALQLACRARAAADGSAAARTDPFRPTKNPQSTAHGHELFWPKNSPSRRGATGLAANLPNDIRDKVLNYRHLPRARTWCAGTRSWP